MSKIYLPVQQWHNCFENNQLFSDWICSQFTGKNPCLALLFIIVVNNSHLERLKAQVG